ncbi:cupin domain protein [Diplodia corticola]|uniref:Cupin domain protein n=1 Tax=Diplodia corticola TaxID=236234 RepID=A0A1J9SKP9_9PEZI|nr:cupin domain protein [Diplodia corticola]OJD40316.1 cupin domain protein [Diplodia corticola]
MAPTVVTPETFWINPTPSVPNSPLPIIVYRRALLDDHSPDTILSTIEPNGWYKGGQWKTFKKAHFHANTHECYGILRGSSVYMLGVGGADLGDEGEPGEGKGTRFFAEAGDVFVLPAGISHCSVESEGDYEYIGLYPGEKDHKGARFDLHWCKDTPEKTKELAEKAGNVPIPECDPLYGPDGPLPRIWKEAMEIKSNH